VVHSFSPVALFVIGGLFLTLFGTAVGIWTIVETLGPPVATAGSVILAVAPWLLGMQMLMYALMLDIQESPDRPTAPPSRPTRAGKRSVPPLPPLVEVDERHAAGNGAVTPAEVAEPDK
jgi:hypothetical protein